MSQIFENVENKKTSAWPVLRGLMWIGIAVFAVVRFMATRSDLEPGILFEPSAPQVAQVWSEYIAQVVLAVTLGTAASWLGDTK